MVPAPAQGENLERTGRASMHGWNIGTPPYGFLAERIPHPVPFKAAQSRTKARLVLDPVRAPVIGQMFTWRVVDKLGIPAIAARLNANLVKYPPPNPVTGWTAGNVAAMLANPKYTGHMVYGRHRNRNGHRIPAPPRPDPATMQLYPYRGRVRCRDCQRRMAGSTYGKPTSMSSYYRCPNAPPCSPANSPPPTPTPLRCAPSSNASTPGRTPASGNYKTCPPTPPTPHRPRCAPASAPTSPNTKPNGTRSKPS